MASKKETHQVLARLAAAYPHFQLTQETISIYCEMLEDVPFPVLLEAAQKQIKLSTFFPTIAELRGPYDENQLRIQQQDQERRWKENLERYKTEALSAGDAKKMLQALTDAANPSKSSLVPFRRRDVRRVLAEPAKRFEVGGSMSEEAWRNRKDRAKSLDEEPRSVRGKEVSTPNSGGGRGA